MWAGYDNNQESAVSNGTKVKQMWADTIEGYFKDKEAHWYETPKNVVGVLIDPISGKVATNDTEKKKMLYYIKGTEPYTDTPDLDASIPTIKQE